MDEQDPKSIKQAEQNLAKIEQYADALEKALARAEAKHPPKIDHAEDGGII